jgi:integrase
LHDLRHTFASMALSSGASLPLIGKLLGHTQPATTARYAHLARDAAAELNDHVGDRLAAALTPDPDRPKAEVVNLAVRRR